MSIHRVGEFLASRTTFVVLIPVILVVAGLIRGGFSFSTEDTSNLSQSDIPSADEPMIRVAIRTIALSEDGAYLDVAQADANGVRRDALTGRQLHPIPLPRCEVPWVQFIRSDGTWAGVNQQNHLEVMRDGVRLWQGLLPGQKPEEPLVLCSMYRYRQLLAVISESGCLWMLDLNGGQAVPRSHHDMEEPLAHGTLSPTGEWIVLVTAGRQYLLWDIAQGEVVTRMECGDPSTAFASWSQDGRRFITFGVNQGQQLAIWEASTGRLVRKLSQDSKLIVAAELSFDGTLAAVGVGDEIRLWNVESGAELPPLIGHREMISALYFADRGRTLFSGDMQGSLRRWSLSDEREIWTAP